MRFFVVTLAVAAWAGTVGNVSGATPFEDVHVVKMPKGTHGYRGMNGDFLLRISDSESSRSVRESYQLRLYSFSVAFSTIAARASAV